MAELVGVPFPRLLSRLAREIQDHDRAFDLPRRKWFVPEPDVDYSAVHHDHRPATPLGPAAGPHTQLAQNIVLSWLAGARIIELKTVQIDDRLEIPRPCIHAPNLGFNVEWSQELRIADTLEEYAKAAYLIEILKQTRVFGRFPEDASLETVFDLSVGYDLAGIRSELVTGFLRSMLDARASIDRLRRDLPPEFAKFRDLAVPSRLSNCVTLSTFHGCPADQIELISRYLLEEIGVHTLVKLNPTLLGYERVKELLHDRLGYTKERLRREAFDGDLQYDDGLAMMRRLKTVAEDQGTTIGAKFTNTLVVENDPGIFPTQRDPYMYLSGPPLHVISMTLMQRFRRDAGFEFPVSFSAGVDAVNVAGAVACGMVPVTTCTDLLKQGGYGRLPAYLRALRRAFAAADAVSRDAYVLIGGGHAEAAVREAFAGAGRDGDAVWASVSGGAGQPGGLPGAVRRTAAEAGLDADAVLLHAIRIAGRRNGDAIVAALPDDPRYHRSRNEKEPRRIESTLALYDCINCDLCIPACPNDAMFAYELPPQTVATDVHANGDSGAEPGVGFRREKEHQLAVFADACNECSNCEIFCPEIGAPFVEKERFFSSEATYAAAPELEGFFYDGSVLHARIGGVEYRVRPDADPVLVSSDDIEIEVAWEDLAVRSFAGKRPGRAVDTAVLWRIKTAWEGVYAGPGASMVNRSI
jgi:putative selenate reductase